MRKHQQKQILDIVETLKEANMEIKRRLLHKNPVSILQLLEDCQEGVVHIGEFIESIQGEGTKTVTLLEEYHETLYLIGTVIENVSASTVRNLQKKLIQIENSVKQELAPDKIEVVFFPYKASMWDSLESIYLAAKEDPACDVYCVPIPYFDKYSDGSFRQMHYEGAEYPEDIEIISWENYDFKRRHPDVIYIHNPYDEWNYVTSVHPMYYASNLNKHTDMLVYVPYFILNEIDPNDEKAVDSMKHYCFLPGVIYADKVILQSENIRQIYINEFIKKMNEQNVEPKLLEEKFVDGGSPKLDKLQRTKKEDCEVPDEWLNIIRKEDGIWKKIVFYNTSVRALLQGRERMLQRMEHVFNVFRACKEDVALLWRPHPLIQATILSMCPQLWEPYQKMVEEYKKENWGIYDDTADLDRALVLSDAYYGDESSVARLCREIGKPTLLQNVVDVNQLNSDEVNKLSVWMIDFCIVGNELWFVHGKVSALMKYNIDTKQTTVIGRVPNEKGVQYGLYYSIHIYEGSVVLIPCSGKEIAVYNIKKEKFTKIGIKNSELCKFGKFRSAYIEDDFLYCIPSSYEEFIRINLDNWNIEYLGNWKNLIPEVNCKDVYISDVARFGKYKYAGLVNGTNKVIVYDAIKKDYSTLLVTDDVCRNIIAIAGNEEKIFAQDRNSGDILCYSSNSRKCKKIYKGLDSIPYKLNFLENKYLIADSIDTKQIVIFDAEGNICYEEQGEVKIQNTQFASEYFFGVWKEKDGIIYFDNVGQTLYHFECTGKTKISTVEIPEEGIKTIGDIIHRAEDDNLRNYIWTK